mmetsp:Transcript_32845/g.82883  ORF Transcript_32845/g.82883 Transcript_32845/m.82883 type:complete len:225 (+) Transcript_32845:1020-1694(+)
MQQIRHPELQQPPGDHGSLVAPLNPYHYSDKMYCRQYFVLSLIDSVLPRCRCLHCKNCVMFGVMDSAEGPGSAFEHFHCFYPKMPDAISYDNGCNLHRYALNREPWLWKFVQILIDEFHAKNHVDCSCNYNSAEHKTKAGNFSLCEQKFAPLAASANAFSHMDQVSFLLLMRFKLACMNLYQWERTRGTGRVFWRAPPRHVARAAGRTDRLDLHGAHCEPLINV